MAALNLQLVNARPARTGNNGLCFTTTASPLREWTEFVVWTFSSLYASPIKSLHLPHPQAAGLGSGLPSRFRDLGFPEFDRFYKRT